MTRDPRTVLIVDDDDDIREVTSMVLGQEGYRTMSAEDGAVALARLREGVHPALILLDLRMPKLDGADFVRQARKECLIDGTPVVVLSGEIGARDECVILDLELLRKPMELDDLVATVHRLAPLS